MDATAKSNQLAKFLIITLATATCYFIAGRLSLLLAAPPGYSSIIWPAAGIALGILLVFGNRYWFGVWLGSMITNFCISYDPQSTTHLLPAISLATGIGLFAAIQALVGASLIRQLKLYPNPLSDIKKIIGFVLIAGPISALINATLSNLLLWFLNIVALQTLLDSWTTWWIGDSIGILIFTPLILIFFTKDERSWKSRSFSVALPLLILFALTVTLFHIIRDKEIHQAIHEFENNVSSIDYLFKRSLDSSENVLTSLQSFFEASSEVTRNEFKQFVKRTLNKHQNIQALSWNPVVLNKDRKKYVLQAKNDGYNNFDFTQKVNGKLVTDNQRPYYYVVYFIEPYIGNQAALGFNLASNPNRLGAMQKAAENNQLVATQRIHLVQKGEGEYGVILFAPVYHIKSDLNSKEGRLKNLQGFLSAVLQMKITIHSILYSNASGAAKDLFINRDISITLNDTSAPNSKQLLYQSNVNSKNAANELLNALSISKNYIFGDRVWKLTIAPTEKYLHKLLTWKYWTSLYFILLFIIIADLFLLLLSGQNVKIKKEVEEQTSKLKKESLEKLQILDSLEEAIIVSDQYGSITFVNPKTLELLKFKEDELIGKDAHQLIHFQHSDGTPYLKDTCVMHTISLKQEKIRSQKDHLIRKDGRVISIIYTKTPIKENDKLIGVSIAFHEEKNR